MNKKHTYLRKFILHLKRTWKNKVAAIVLLAGSSIPMWLDGDGTAFMFMAIICIPLMFSKNNTF